MLQSKPKCMSHFSELNIRNFLKMCFLNLLTYVTSLYTYNLLLRLSMVEWEDVITLYLLSLYSQTICKLATR